MNTTTGFVCIGALLTLAAPAFCGPQASIVGRWLLPTDGSGHSAIFEFKPDGTEATSRRKGKVIVPMTFKSGKPLILRYAVIGDKVTMTCPNHKVDEYRFNVKADTLTFTKVLVFQSQPNHGELHGSTLTRFRG